MKNAQQPPRVLFVTENNTLAENLKAQLEPRGYQVTTVVKAPDLERPGMQAEAFDLLILDQLNGDFRAAFLRFFKLCRGTETSLTLLLDEIPESKSLFGGAAVRLRRPFTPDQLIFAVKMVIPTDRA